MTTAVPPPLVPEAPTVGLANAMKAPCAMGSRPSVLTHGPDNLQAATPQNRNDAKSKICFFISYGDEKFSYRFWDEQNRKIIKSKIVIFNEQVMYKD